SRPLRWHTGAALTSISTCIPKGRAMLLQSLQPFSLQIPFKEAFRHASAERSSTQTLIVKAVSHAGIAGYGEGCPREYVTGETIESAITFVATHQPELLDRIDD